MGNRSTFRFLVFGHLHSEAPRASLVIITKNSFDILKRNLWKDFGSD